MLSEHTLCIPKATWCTQQTCYVLPSWVQFSLWVLACSYSFHTDQLTAITPSSKRFVIWSGPLTCSFLENFQPCFPFFFFFSFFGHPTAYRVPRPGIRSKTWLQPKLELHQHQILNPLCQAGDWTWDPVLPRHCRSHWATAGTPPPWFSLSLFQSDYISFKDKKQVLELSLFPVMSD